MSDFESIHERLRAIVLKHRVDLAVTKDGPAGMHLPIRVVAGVVAPSNCPSTRPNWRDLAPNTNQHGQAAPATGSGATAHHRGWSSVRHTVLGSGAGR